ncbi:MAG: tRNA epoxyqueuosine(34) reductase QueG [Pseudomonadota bacterium]
MSDAASHIALPSRELLLSWAQAMGFADIGITDVDLSQHEPYVRQWLAAGFAGDMGYLNRNLEKRLDPAQLEPDTCRVISARMDYLVEGAKPITVLENSSLGYVSRYALGRDYHKVLRRRLAKLTQQINQEVGGYNYRAFTDSAPVLEKALAQKSGLGWMGKHSLILNPEAGSWFFLGEIYTNAPFPIDTHSVEDQCGNCSACMTVCPTDAIISPKQLDARRCISYLTIEHKGSIPETLRPAMGNRIYGCDDCQLYCPWNREEKRTKKYTDEPDFAVRHNLDAPDLLQLFLLSESEFLKMTEGSAMRRVGYQQWQRNIAVALGNGPARPEIISALRDRLKTADDLVAEHINWALDRLAA